MLDMKNGRFMKKFSSFDNDDPLKNKLENLTKIVEHAIRVGTNEKKEVLEESLAFLLSVKNTSEQHFHSDYNPEDSNIHGSTILSITSGNTINLENELLNLPQGSMLTFTGHFIHAGSRNESGSNQLRVFAYYSDVISRFIIPKEAKVYFSKKNTTSTQKKSMSNQITVADSPQDDVPDILTKGVEGNENPFIVESRKEKVEYTEICPIQIARNGQCSLLSALVSIYWVSKDNPDKILSEVGKEFFNTERCITSGSLELLQLMAKHYCFEEGNFSEKMKLMCNELKCIKQKKSTPELKSKLWFAHNLQHKVPFVSRQAWLGLGSPLTMCNENLEGEEQPNLLTSMLNMLISDTYPVFIFQLIPSKRTPEEVVYTKKQKKEVENVVSAMYHFKVMEPELKIVYDVILWAHNSKAIPNLQNIWSLAFLFQVVSSRNDTCVISFYGDHFTTLVPNRKSNTTTSSTHGSNSNRISFSATIGKIHVSPYLMSTVA